MAASEHQQLPPGLATIHNQCQRCYPDQPNPLQVATIVKYWANGPDPLDYISVYRNKGNAPSVPPHWHYISCGLSDLYGDGRLHETTGRGQPSGYGFEITFRLKREETDATPPTWPAELMQSLAKYVFQSDNLLCPGDHISWHKSLDSSESRIQHMLLREDPQLSPIDDALGTCAFVQVVGVTADELEAAQKWNGPGILELLKGRPETGGEWSICDMYRGESLFELDPSYQSKVDEGVCREGSNLSGVSGVCSWEDADGVVGIGGMADSTLAPAPLPEVHQLPPADDHGYVAAELIRTRTLDFVHVKFNKESGSLLPLVLKGRLKHGRHFTFKSAAGDVAITLVTTSVEGSFADNKHPYAAHGPWLHILVEDDFLETLINDLEELTQINKAVLPKTYNWKDKNFAISIIQTTIHNTLQ